MPGLLVLNLRCGRWRLYAMVLLPDTLDPDTPICSGVIAGTSPAVGDPGQIRHRCLGM